MPARLNLRQVEIFHALMLNGTTQRTAEVLRLSQPAVSKAIQELEAELGFALFRRERKRLVPTVEARLYLREVEVSFVALSRLRSAAARIRDFGSGEIRIATLSALSTTILPGALRRFRDDNPGVSLTLQVSLSSTVRDLVMAGQVDVGLAADEIDTTGLDAQPYGMFPSVIALPAGHMLCAKDVIGPADLQDADFIALSPEDTTRRAFDHILAARGVAPRIMLETPFSTTVCAMVQAGLGCGLVNPLTAAPYLGSDRGLTLRPFRPSVEFRTLLIRPASGPSSRHADRLVMALHAELETVKARLATLMRRAPAS